MGICHTLYIDVAFIATMIRKKKNESEDYLKIIGCGFVSVGAYNILLSKPQRWNEQGIANLKRLSVITRKHLRFQQVVFIDKHNYYIHL